jgi:KDO2-lipid IV(A) lauroyltransferase
MILSCTKKIAYLGAWMGVETGRFAVKFLPRRWLYRFSDTLAHFGFYFVRGYRQRSTKNLAGALADKLDETEIREIVRRSLQNFLRDFVEIAVALVLPAEQLRSEIPLYGRENLDAALAKGNGVIALSAHLGNFFLVGTRLAAEGYSTHVLVNQPRNGQFAKLMDHYRLQVGQKTIHARPRHDALRELGQVLRRREMAVIIADEHRKEGGIHVPFFGRTVLARRGPATIALRTGAAVVPVYLVRDDDETLKLVIEPELELVRTGKRRAAIRENTLSMTQWLERTVRNYPDQWNWMNIHWQDSASGRAAGEKPQMQRLTY